VAQRIGQVWTKQLQHHLDLDLFADYLVREKARLDNQNPLFQAGHGCLKLSCAQLLRLTMGQ
jgi:hypothetical protein